MLELTVALVCLMIAYILVPSWKVLLNGIGVSIFAYLVFPDIYNMIMNNKY